MHKEEDVVMQNAIDDKKVAKENFKSKNLHSERKRRERINQRIYALRAVVPNVTKVLPENSFQVSSYMTLFLWSLWIIAIFLYAYSDEQKWNS